MSRTRARAGFTLLEALVAVVIAAMLAAAAIPVARRAIQSSARKATRAELVQLGHAAQAYFRDTRSSPRRIQDLVRPSDAEGWSGPYLPDDAPRAAIADDAFERDAWARQYRFAFAGDVLTITSRGPDAALDTNDDVRIHVDFTAIRCEETLAELADIQLALELYSDPCRVHEPLPLDWERALAMLVESGFLYDADTYAHDAWGNEYHAEPAAVWPSIRVVSTSMAESMDLDASVQLDPVGNAAHAEK